MEISLDRVLVIAPHPDDESIGAGGLVQRTIAAGGQVRVVIVTDGDNNPWPLRVLKKKIRISKDERAEWGALRREESLRALALLGAPRSATFLGFQDRMLTRMGRRGDFRAREGIVAAIKEFSPTLVVIPSTFDLHADHRAIAWMGHAAAAGCSVITYIVHGHPPPGRAALRLDLTPDEAARKRAAIECHQSQLVLSRKRFLSYARASEEFFEAEFDLATLDSHVRDWSYALRHAARVVTSRGKS